MNMRLVHLNCSEPGGVYALYAPDFEFVQVTTYKKPSGNPVEVMMHCRCRRCGTQISLAIAGDE